MLKYTEKSQEIKSAVALMLICFYLIFYLFSLSKESSTTTASTGVTDTVKVTLSIVLRLSVTPVLELQIVAQNGSRLTTIHICLWDLRIKVMKLTPTPCSSCATKCYQTGLRHLPNFVDLILITLHINTKPVFSNVSLRN